MSLVAAHVASQWIALDTHCIQSCSAWSPHVALKTDRSGVFAFGDFVCRLCQGSTCAHMLQEVMSSGERRSPNLEQHMKRILELNGPLGLLELLAFMMSCVGVDGDSSTQGLCIQLWLPPNNEPIVLFQPSCTQVTRAAGSRRTFVYNLLAVTLPMSQQVVWLPLEMRGHTEVRGQWEQRFSELDQQVCAAANSEATASSSSAAAPMQSASVGLRARGRLPGCSNGSSRTTTVKRARRN